MTEKLLRDEKGFTTLGMTIALLLALSLILSSAQVYRINAASSSAQDVADAAALAAQNEVAEFMVMVRVCDAVVLSLSLASSVSWGAGVVCLCAPPAAGLAERFFEVSKSLASARSNFAQRASNGLNAFQKTLPFLAALRVSRVAHSNSQGKVGAYEAFALLFPLVGEDIVVPDDDDQAQAQDDQALDEVEDLSEEAERLAEDAAQAKEAGFMADCGRSPSYCMYERADSLSPISSANNPLYRSADTWSFSVGLERTRAYYQARLDAEHPESSSVADQAQSQLRKRFYAYAVEQLKDAYVIDEDDAFSAYLPLLPKNTDEMRKTSLYTQVVYPITVGEEGSLMHAWSGCPRAQGAQSLGSLQQMESGDFETCPDCGFTAAKLGSIAALTSTVDTGFERHYREFASAAQAYQTAREKLDPVTKKTRSLVEDLLEECKEWCAKAKDYRIYAAPPGNKGALALVIDTASISPGEMVGSRLVKGSAVLGARVAWSAATLVEASSEEGKTVLNSVLDGFKESETDTLGLPQFALSLWSGLLSAYADGQQGLSSFLEDTLNALPLVGKSGLGTWASNTFQDLIASVGLQPAKLEALKPVLVNSSYVAADADDPIAARFLWFKEEVRSGLSAFNELLIWAKGVT